MNLIKRLFHIEKPKERQTKPESGISASPRLNVIIKPVEKAPKMEGNIRGYCDYHGVELFIGDEKSDYDICARMRSKDGEEEFVIETVTKKEPYEAVSPYLGNVFVEFDTQITYPGKRSIYAMGGNLHISNGYAFRNGNHLVDGEMCGPKNWRHFDMGDNHGLSYEVLNKFEPAIALLEHLVGRSLVKRDLKGEQNTK